jgi:phosphatidylserine synthase
VSDYLTLIAVLLGVLAIYEAIKDRFAITLKIVLAIIVIGAIAIAFEHLGT